jgi:hypothetical protein
MGGVKIKKISPKQFKNAVAGGVAKFTGFDPRKIHSAKDFGKQLASGVYTVSGAKQVVTSGKALSKCKPNDSKCIAANLGGIAAVGVGKIPGVGFVAGVAMSQGLQQAQQKTNKDIQKKKEADKKVEEAKRVAAAATTPEAKRVAEHKLKVAEQQQAAAAAVVAKDEKKVSVEKEKAEEVQQQVLEQVKQLPPEKQEQIFQQSQQAIAQPNSAAVTGDASAISSEKPTAAQLTSEVQATEAAEGNKLIAAQQYEQSKALEAISAQLVEKKIMGIPQTKFFMIVGGFAFVLLFLVMLLK